MKHYSQLLSELRALEAIQLKYTDLVLRKERQMLEHLAKLLGIPIEELEARFAVETPSDPKQKPLTMEEHKRVIIGACLERHGGNITRAAAELGVMRDTIRGWRKS